MPEGDTIRRLADDLNRRFGGQQVLSSVFRHPRLATLNMAGQQFQSADAHGKHLLMRFDNGRSLHIHLRMNGSVVRGIPRNVPAYRRRFDMQFTGGWIAGIDLPVLELLRTRDEASLLAYLGPDICGTYNHRVALERLAHAGTMPLSAAMLDQRLAAGFGNIYAVETPFIVGLNPFTPVAAIENLDAVLSIGVALIRTNARRGPQNTRGIRLDTSEHWVLNRHIRVCRWCDCELVRIEGAHSPWGRRTAFCPQCQPDSQTQADLGRASTLLKLHPARQLLDPATLRLKEQKFSQVETLPTAARPTARYRRRL